MTNSTGTQLIRSIALPPLLDEALAELARKAGVSVSEWVRRVIAREIERVGQ